MRHSNIPVMTSVCLVLALPLACSTSSSSGETMAGPDGGEQVIHNTPALLGYTEALPMLAPASATLGAMAVDGSSGALYVASGGAILRGDASAGGGLATFVDLSSASFSSVSAMRVVANGDLVVASSDRAVRVSSQGDVGAVTSFTLPFAASGFGGPSLAVSPDGASLFAVEGGSGSPGSAGSNVVHVARFVLGSDGGGGVASPAEVFELGPPFEVVPATTAAINADAPFVSLDGTLLYVPHVVLRNVFAVTVSAPHAVSILDTDSLDRSATSTSLDQNGLLVESAVFDQTVPVFRVKSNTTASFLVEIPIGLSPGAVASYQQRVFVAMASGFGGGGGPPPLDGGTPADGGFSSMDGGFPGGPGGPGGGAGGGAPSIRVFDLQVDP